MRISISNIGLCHEITFRAMKLMHFDDDKMIKIN